MSWIFNSSSAFTKCIFAYFKRSYAKIPTSLEFPGLDAALINRFLEQCLRTGETTLIRAFRREFE